MVEKIKAINLGDLSDGYHTFNELYNHRHMLFIALCKEKSKLAWRSLLHDDGTGYDGWFIAGMHLHTGDISYHLPIELWNLMEGVNIISKAPKWDGHTADDVLNRLESFIDTGITS